MIIDIDVALFDCAKFVSFAYSEGILKAEYFK